MRENYDETFLLARLRSREADATTDLVDAYLERLCATLQSHFPTLPPSLCVDDFVIDSLLRFGKNPYLYEPKRGMSLFSYLVQDARGDLLNAIARERRHNGALSSVVEQLFPVRNISRNNETEATALANLSETPGEIPNTPPTTNSMSDFLLHAASIIKEPYDEAVLALLWREERKTEPYARVMGIGDLPTQEQRTRVKQAKDRLKVALKRLGMETR